MATFAQQTTPDVNSPHILLMGPRRSGKSSIQRVVFYKMSPHETLFLESTNTLGSSKIFFPLFFFSPLPRQPSFHFRSHIFHLFIALLLLTCCSFTFKILQMSNMLPTTHQFNFKFGTFQVIFNLRIKQLWEIRVCFCCCC